MRERGGGKIKEEERERPWERGVIESKCRN